MSAYLQFSNLAKEYGGVRAIDQISFSVERGSIVATLGPNGAGKSTLFGCLLGLTWPSRGQVLMHGRRLTDGDRSKFGYVAERIAVYPHRTVVENAAFFAALKGHAAEEGELQLNRVGLYELRNRKVRQLSKGMLQRLGLAIALCGQPEVLVLDEPFNGLDPVLLDTFQSIVQEENRRGATLLISTHTISAIEPLATRVAVLLDGRLAAYDTLDGIRADYGPDDTLDAIYHRIARSRGEANKQAEEAVV
jgi:ABC-type multidrug transport system ATPase subunit